MKKRLFRKESDFLGTKLIYDDLYYGIQTYRAIHNFPITGETVCGNLIKNILLVKKAACLANLKLNILENKKGKAILQAINKLIQNFGEDYEYLFPLDRMQGGAYTSVNMNVNEVIANMALEMLGQKKGNYLIVHPNDDVNKGQSTNDVLPTAMHLTTINLITKINGSLTKLIKSLNKKANEFKNILKLGRTHLQDAVPMTLGLEFGAWADMIKINFKSLIQLITPLSFINLGGTAIGTSEGTNQKFINLVTNNLVQLTKIRLKTATNLIAATQDQTIFSQVSSSLKIISLNLSKIASDLRLLASGPRGGFGEITLPSLQPGSSIMPGKVNPVIPELVNQTCFLIMGNDLTIALACESAQLELNVMFPIIADKLINSFETLNNIINIFDKKCIIGIKVNEKKCLSNLEKSTAFVTSFVDKIGYDKASELAKKVIFTEKSIKEIACKEYNISEKEYYKIINKNKK